MVNQAESRESHLSNPTVELTDNCEWAEESFRCGQLAKKVLTTP